MDIHFLLFFLLFSVRTARTAGLPGGHSVFTGKNPQRETIGAAEGFVHRCGRNFRVPGPFRETATGVSRGCLAESV
jgi:hypothetical protein